MKFLLESPGENWSAGTLTITPSELKEPLPASEEVRWLLPNHSRALHRMRAPSWVEIRGGYVKYRAEGRPENQTAAFPREKRRLEDGVSGPGGPLGSGQAGTGSALMIQS